MNILALVGSYRKHRTIDTLTDKVLEGARYVVPDVVSEKIYLIDRHIEYCRNCMICKEDDPAKPIARCAIHDDMDDLCAKILQADAYILGTPVNYATVTAVMKTFLERACWVLSRPGNWPIKGCPTSRLPAKKRQAVILVSSGVVPPYLRWFCDDATQLLRDFCKCDLNSRIAGSLYAGAIQKTGVEPYLQKAFNLGKKLAS